MTYEDDRQAMEQNDELLCPFCKGDAVLQMHRDGDGLAPECHYQYCEDCGKQWGHE